ncbi:MAG: hypothetical protein R3264_00370 [Anaerolineae bacterium]|nr:hypothetical protein [Anaerolineae bacterium]
MSTLLKRPSKLAFLIILSFTLLFSLASKPAQAQWPPFSLRFSPVHEDGKITYNFTFSDRVDWQMTDISINIPLPEGTQFLEAGAQDGTEVTFDGQEIRFFTSVLHRPIRTAYFIVEVIDPGKIDYETFAWVSWKGENPGSFSTDPITVDTTLIPLKWSRPSTPRLLLESEATVTEDTITYTVYPYNRTSIRMWDLRLRIPVPEGSTLVSIDAPGTFVAEFDGKAAYFSTIEMASQTELEKPLQVEVSTAEVIAPVTSSQIWASWKNSNRRAGINFAAQEQLFAGELIIQPGLAQESILDTPDDTPFGDYDLTAISLLDQGDTISAVFHTAAGMCEAEAPIEFRLWIDSDCSPETGANRRGVGADFELVYLHDRQRAGFREWDAATESWTTLENKLDYAAPLGSLGVNVSIPSSLLNGTKDFCWIARSRYRTDIYTPSPTADWAPDNNRFGLTAFSGNPAAITSTVPPTTTTMVVPDYIATADATICQTSEVSETVTTE